MKVCPRSTDSIGFGGHAQPYLNTSQVKLTALVPSAPVSRSFADDPSSRRSIGCVTALKQTHRHLKQSLGSICPGIDYRLREYVRSVATLRRPPPAAETAALAKLCSQRKKIFSICRVNSTKTPLTCPRPMLALFSSVACTSPICARNSSNASNLPKQPLQHCSDKRSPWASRIQNLLTNCCTR